MRNVLMLPTPHQAANDDTNSIHQIVLKLEKHLPEFGYQVTESGHQAEFIAGHAGQTYTDIQVDVAHCHGLYPTAYPNLTLPWHLAANNAVLQNLIRAKQVTVPSQWVADILRRDMHIEPAVVPWAIDFEDWPQGVSQGYVLWNKTRADGVCDPKPVTELAKLATNQAFLSTFADAPGPNVRVIGRQPYSAMKPIIAGAAVYLATTKETFGIGILEAMASGVPILGFKHGNVSMLVQHGVTGYLVDPGDYEGLRAGLDYCLQHRAILGANARQAARAYTWQNSAMLMAKVYDQLYPIKKPKVSVVIPLYNYGKYVATAIDSVFMQETQYDTELVVVNDGSTDDSLQAAELALIEHRDSKISARLLNLVNGGVAYARNSGIAQSTGDLIVCLDADDKLGDKAYIETLATAMIADRSMGIAFSGLQMMSAEGVPGAISGWPNGFDYNAQLAGRNQVPTCCMFRREAWRRAGGYHGEYTPAEDADLWLRITSLGYKAEQVTTAPMFVYRLHGQSLSSPVREGKKVEPNWRGDKPYAEDKKYPFGAGCVARPVRNYDRPKVSIIIPCADYHVPYLPQALASVEGQTERYWQCIVVNDTGKPELPGLAPYPWAEVVSTAGHAGAGIARNVGIKAATAPFVAFLDADDMLLPMYLEKTLNMYQRTGRYVYTDWYSITKDNQMEMHATPEFTPGEVFKAPMQHSINILVKRDWLLQAGLFNETLPSWEDVDLFMRLAVQGICGARVGEPLTIYRYQTGRLREKGEGIKADLLAYFNEQYGQYIQGAKMCGCSQPGPGVRTTVQDGQSQAIQGQGNPQALTRIIYNGPAGNHDVVGPALFKNYGRRAGGDIFYVFEADRLAKPETFVAIAEVFDEKSTTPVPPAPTPLNA